MLTSLSKESLPSMMIFLPSSGYHPRAILPDWSGSSRSIVQTDPRGYFGSQLSLLIRVKTIAESGKGGGACRSGVLITKGSVVRERILHLRLSLIQAGCKDNAIETLSQKICVILRFSQPYIVRAGCSTTFNLLDASYALYGFPGTLTTRSAVRRSLSTISTPASENAFCKASRLRWYGWRAPRSKSRMDPMLTPDRVAKSFWCQSSNPRAARQRDGVRGIRSNCLMAASKSILSSNIDIPILSDPISRDIKTTLANCKGLS